MKHKKIKKTIILLFLICNITGCSYYKNIIEPKKTNIDLPELKADIEEIKLQKVNFVKNKRKENIFCLNEDELKKLYSNIIIIKSRYNEIIEKYKRTIDNYNVLKKIAYEK